MIATGFQAAWSFTGKLEHEEQFSHQEQRVQATNQHHREDQVARGQRRVRDGRRQHLTDSPRLTAIFGDKPARFNGNPRQRQAIERGAQQPFFLTDAVANHAPEGGADNQQHQHAARYHDTEGEVERRHGRNRVLGRQRNLLFRRVRDVVGIAFQQQTVAQIFLHVVKAIAHGLVG